MSAMRFAAAALIGSITMAVAGCGGESGDNTTSGASTSTGSSMQGGDGGPTGSKVVADGYVTAGPWMGYGFTATDPGAATITPNCTTSCTPAFTGSTFCMQGTVTGRTDYSGFAMLGWDVNQPMSTTSTSTTAGTWPIPASGSVTVTVDNPGTTPLRFQLQGTDPHSGADRWCADLVSGQPMEWTSLKTNCWTGGTPQTPLAAGTPIQQAAIIVPGTQQDLPFNLCLTDIQIQ